MKKLLLLMVGITISPFIKSQCISPANTNCNLRQEVWVTCDPCNVSPSDNTYYTQCSPAGSYISAATNAPSGAIPDDEVWFSFTPPRTITGASTSNSKVTITVIGNCQMNPIIELYNTPCPTTAGPALGVGFSNGSYVATLSMTLNDCEEYAFRVYHKGSGTVGDGDFQLFVNVDNPDNDECSAPYPLLVNNTWVDATNVNATPSDASTNCTSTGPGYKSGATYDDDVWFSFIAPSSDITRISVKGIAQCNSELSTNFDPVFELWNENPCDNPLATPLKCINEYTGNNMEVHDFNCLEELQTYYIRVTDYNAIDCISGAEFQIKAHGINCSPPSNDNFCNALILQGSWPDYNNDGIEDGNAAGVAPNTHSAYRIHGNYGHNPRISCASFESGNNEPILTTSGGSGKGQTVWYRFLAPENCDADVLLHTNSTSTDFNTVIAVYETLPGYTDDPTSSLPTTVTCGTDLASYINTTAVASNDDWPVGGPTITSGYHNVVPHFSTPVPSGSTNSYIALTTGSTPGYTQINPGQFYYVQVDALESDACAEGSFDLYYQVVQNEVPAIVNFTVSCGASNYNAQIEWTCDVNPPDTYKIRREDWNPQDEPVNEMGPGTYAITPAIITSPGTGTQTADLDCLPCESDVEVWVFYENTTYLGSSISSRATSQTTRALRFTTPACPPGASPIRPEGSANEVKTSYPGHFKRLP